MDLKMICDHIIDVERGLDYGTITFSYDNLMSAMKAGHPLEILDDILSNIFWDVREGKEPSIDTLIETLRMLKEYKKCFKIKELGKPIKELMEYIQNIQKE